MERKEADKKEMLKKRFFIRYREMVDLDMVKMYPEKYKKRLAEAGRVTEGINFNNNILICLGRDISKEIFLSGFSRLDYYASYNLMGVEELRNIYFGNYSSWNNESEDFYVNDCSSIKGDVMCLNMNMFETANKLTEDIIMGTILSRYVSNALKGKKLHWLYFMGTDRELKEKYPRVRAEFLKEERENFKFYDLNGRIGDIRKSTRNDIYDL